MSGPRQKSIGLTPREKERLDKAKQLYEENTGDKTDFGKFLALVTAVGLAAMGIRKLSKSSQSNPVVECPECGHRFSIAYVDDLPRIVYVRCPQCSEEVVVDLGE